MSAASFPDAGSPPAKGLATSRADRILEALRRAWVVAFLAYMFLPLLYMALAAFNASRFPTLLPWRGFTLEWFAAAAADPKLARAVVTSFAVAIAVVALSTVLGLAGALIMTRVRTRASNLLYAVLVSPVLTPGIVLGLATAIFWDRAAEVSGFWGLAVLGQSSFISAYCMLIFIARLQRFDTTLEEAALDLGATPFQIFRTITLPYLMPSIVSAGALAFMQSLENYNTTLFTIGQDITLTIYIAGKLRLGVTPVINALACMLVVLTVVAALAYELARRRSAAAAPVIDA